MSSRSPLIFNVAALLLSVAFVFLKNGMEWKGPGTGDPSGKFSRMTPAATMLSHGLVAGLSRGKRSGKVTVLLTQATLGRRLREEPLWKVTTALLGPREKREGSASLQEVAK